MKYKEKYLNLIFNNKIANSEDEAEILIDTLYQLAFITVQQYLNERMQKC